MREKGHKYGVLVGKTVGRRPLGKTWHKCRDNIKMYHKKYNVSTWYILTWLQIKTNGGRL
jgi:hypothetical protein